MSERLVPNELTGVTPSSKLDITHLKTNGRFAMDKDGKELPQPIKDGAPSMKPTSSGIDPEIIRNLFSGSEQSVREAGAAILRELAARGEKVSPELRRSLIASGAFPISGGADDPGNEDWDNAQTAEQRVVIRSDDITDPKIKNALERLQLKYNNPSIAGLLDPEEDVKALYALEGVDPQQLEIAMGRIGDIVQRQRSRERTIQEARKFQDFHTFVLQNKDMQELQEDSEGWLNNQFNILYAIAEQGAELDSPQVRALESKFNDAVSFLVTRGKTSKEVRDFQIRYNTMVGYLIGGAQVDRRSLEGIQGSAARLGATGLLTGFSFDGGRVGAMFNRMGDMVDDTRIREGGINKKDGTELQHLSPEMISKLHQKLEDEQYTLAIKGAGVFADHYKAIRQKVDSNEKAQSLLKDDIRRTVRTASGAFRLSQRQAVIASRGRQYTEGPYDFFTDPKSIFDMFNIEEFLTGKWGSLDSHQKHFLHELKLDLARHSAKGNIQGMSEAELTELGTRLLRDLFVVPDFFSSGWRIRGTIDKIEQLQLYYAYNDAIINDLFTVGRGRNSDALKDKLRTVDEYIAHRVSTDGITNDEMYRVKKDLYREFLSKGIVVNGEKVSFSFEERQEYINALNLSPEQKRLLDATAKSNADNLALFMRLKAKGGDRLKGGEDTRTVQDIWKKVREYRPEEMIKVVRGRSGKLGRYDEIRRIDKIFTDAGLTVTEEHDARGQKVTIGAYDKFKKDYGAVLSSIREKALRGFPPKPVDFKNLTADQKAEIDRAVGVGGARIVETAYKGMDSYIRSEALIDQFINGTDYEDIYNRTMVVDDTIMDQLEIVPENSGLKDGELTGYWASERGGDALVRNYNDLAAAQQAGGSFVKFLTSHTKDDWQKNATEFAHHVEGYNGREGAAKAFRYTYGSYLLIAEQFYGWDILGVGELPWRQDSSKLEQIFGQGVDAMTREKILKELDHVRGTLTFDGRNPDLYYDELMRLAGTDTFSRLRDKGFQVFIYTMLVLMLAPMAGAAKAMGAATK